MKLIGVRYIPNSFAVETYMYDNEPTAENSLLDALRRFGCKRKTPQLRSNGLIHLLFENEVVVAVTHWYEADDTERQHPIERLDVDKDFARKYRDKLTEIILPGLTADCISESESWLEENETLSEHERERISQLCADEVEKLFEVLDD